jgi:hypothetical protein
MHRYIYARTSGTTDDGAWLYRVDDEAFVDLWESICKWTGLVSIQEIHEDLAHIVRRGLHTPVDDARLHWLKFRLPCELAA